MNCCSSRSQISAPALIPTQTVSKSSDPLSIWQIARLHPRERILVAPITWTSRHLELLGCSFQDAVAAPPNTELDLPVGNDGYPYVKEYLRSWIKYTYRQSNIQRLLTMPECPLSCRPGVILRFDRISTKLRCALLYSRDGMRGSMVRGQPVAAYIDLGELERLRKDTLRCYLPRQYNPLCYTIWDNRWKKLDPPEPLHDPYIFALLIAVAQEKQKHMQEANSTPESQINFVSSQVLCSFKSKEYLRLYTAIIPSSLLDMFHDPSWSPPSPFSVSIRIYAVPISPEPTLRARLLGLLCSSHIPLGRKRSLDDDSSDLSPPSKRGRIDSNQHCEVHPITR